MFPYVTTAILIDVLKDHVPTDNGLSEILLGSIVQMWNSQMDNYSLLSNAYDRYVPRMKLTHCSMMTKLS